MVIKYKAITNLKIKPRLRGFFLFMVLLSKTIRMRKILALLFVITSFAANAQTEKGRKLIGVNTSLNYTTINLDAANDIRNFNLNLRGGYFIKDNNVLGINFGYQFLQQGTLEERIISYGIFGRHYFFGVIFAGVGFNATQYRELDPMKTVPVELGYSTFIRNIIAIEPSVTYDIALTGNTNNSFSFQIGFVLYLE